jgi:RimJ/RimL family protein N-acetyltransferase
MPTIAIVPLTTERLVLSRPSHADIPEIIALANDFDIARRLTRMPYPYTEADAHQFLDDIVPNEAAWKVTLRDSGAMLGVVGLTQQDDGDTAEFGYWYGRAHWGSGYATEAGRAVVDHAFGEAGIRMLLSGYFEGNTASGRVLRKLGFTETGRSRIHCRALAADVPRIDMQATRPG